MKFWRYLVVHGRDATVENGAHDFYCVVLAGLYCVGDVLHDDLIASPACGHPWSCRQTMLIDPCKTIFSVS
jgi:hypothetical protein